MLARRGFVPVAAFVVIWTLTMHGKFSVSGDEPHYLMVTHSILADADYDLRNNHAQGDSRHFGVERLEAGPHVRETRQGALYSVHDVALSVLLVPAYATALAVSSLPSAAVLDSVRLTRGLFTYSLISMLLIALSAWAALLTRDALVAGGLSPARAGALVLALWLAPPVLSNSFLVFPEVVALLVTAWALRLSTRAGESMSTAEVLLFTLAIGTMPWLHRKFVVYAPLLLLAVIWRQQARARALSVPARLGAAMCLTVPPAILAVWTLYHWGNLGGPLMLDRVPLSAGVLRQGIVGLLVDRENGLFVWAPIYLLVPVTWMIARRRDLVWLPAIAALFLLSASHDLWWGGFSPAGRFLVPLTPLVAALAAWALQYRWFRVAAVALLVPTVVISACGWQNPRALWPRGDGENRMLTMLLPAGRQQWLPSLRSREGTEQLEGTGSQRRNGATETPR